MPTLIERAKAHQRAAMLRLVEQTSAHVYNTAYALTANEEHAKTATVRTYRAVWNVLNTVADEKAFATLTATTVINQCKLLMLAKNAKAFRLPSDRRFAVNGLAVPADADAYGVVAALPELQRLIFVCHAVAGLSDADTAALCKLDARTLAVAVADEKQTLAGVPSTNNSVTFESVEELAALCTVKTVPTDVEETVMADIIAIVSPKEKERRKKTFLTAGIIVGVCVLITGLCAIVLWDMTRPEGVETTSGDDTTTPTTTADAPEALDLTYSTDYTATHTAEISIQDYGVIKLELDANMAPETVENFKQLSEQGFYDGLTLHRIMEGFMMQGGCPYGNGTGGADKDLKGEFAQNGVANTLTHTRGAISMARSNDPNSASSQFFIVHEDSTFLDGQYAAFGYVTEGMDVVDAICTAVSPKATDGNGGGIPTADQPVIEYVIVNTI